MSEREERARPESAAYGYTCTDCGIDGELVESLDRALEQFERCSSRHHTPEFERKDGYATTNQG